MMTNTTKRNFDPATQNDGIHNHTFSSSFTVTKSIDRKVTIETVSTITENLGRTDMFPGINRKQRRDMCDRLEIIFKNIIRAHIMCEKEFEFIKSMCELERLIMIGDFEKAMGTFTKIYPTQHPEWYIQLMVATLYECSIENIGTMSKFRNMVRDRVWTTHTMAVEVYKTALEKIDVARRHV